MADTVPPLVFTDTETTSLRPNRRIWEFAAITRPAGGTRADDVEYQWFVKLSDLDLGDADPQSLKIGRFYERHPQMNGADIAPGDKLRRGSFSDADPVNRTDVLKDEKLSLLMIERMTRFSWIVGAVPNFDTECLSVRMRATGVCPAWHYHLIDVENIAAGALAAPPPWGFDDLLSAFDLTYDETERHTALGDARMARDLYDKVITNRRARIDAAALAAARSTPVTLKLVPQGGDDAPAG